MERATAPQLRKSLEAAGALKDAGIRFVPMPVINEADHASCVLEMQRRLDLIADLSENN